MCEVGLDVGMEILVNGGKFVYVCECGWLVGMWIEVMYLFNLVLVWWKFLKMDVMEVVYII